MISKVNIDNLIHDLAVNEMVSEMDDFFQDEFNLYVNGDEQIKDIHLHNWLNTATQALNDIDDAYSNEAFDDATQGRLFWMIHDFKNLLLIF